jgi:long-chain acyl-CoA synthetase
MTWDPVPPSTGADTEPPVGLAEATATLTGPGQLFEMDTVEVRGVATRVWRSAPPSLRLVLDLSLGYGDDDFLVYEDERTTFAQHYRNASTLAHRLRDDLEVKTGDRVAIAMRNLPEWVTAFWAITSIGAVAVPLNAWWTGDELRFGLLDSGSVVAFVDQERATRLRPQLDDLPYLRHLVVANEDRGVPAAPDVRGDGRELDYAEVLGDVATDAVPPDVPLQPDDDATIFYTSGTTGRPKGAVGTHRNACSNLMNLYFVNTLNKLRYGSSLIEAPGTDQSSYLLSVPLFHVTGCLAVMISNAAAGGKLVMMRRFDPERALELIERERITTFGGVPTVVMRILDSPSFGRRDLTSVRSVSYGGAPAPPELVRHIKKLFPSSQPGNGYGLTETSGVACMITGEDYVRRPESVGPVLPVTDVVVVPEDFDGPTPNATLPAGPDVAGELWIKGPQVVRGYWHREEETADVLTTGWLHTGDVARIDEEGYISIVDRAKDVVIRGGENVYCVEIEDVLYEHPAVAECAVVGVPHPTLGEEVCAVVVLHPGRKVTAEELVRHVGDRLAAFKVPTRILFRAKPLPRNPAGKVLKRTLRLEAAQTAEKV